MKRWIGATIVFLVLIISGCWLFVPGWMPWMRNIWELSGRPELLTRAIIFFGFLFFVFFAAVKVGKNGPI
ncbi:MAG: hypothetical protein ACLFUS_17845 [Candidatus Sumerlaeia bacterium]